MSCGRGKSNPTAHAGTGQETTAVPRAMNRRHSPGGDTPMGWGHWFHVLQSDDLHLAFPLVDSGGYDCRASSRTLVSKSTTDNSQDEATFSSIIQQLLLLAAILTCALLGLFSLPVPETLARKNRERTRKYLETCQHVNGVDSRPPPCQFHLARRRAVSYG